MIPIRNKRKTLQVTVDEMRNFAFVYVEKYAPSKQQLKTYLLKKYLKLIPYAWELINHRIKEQNQFNNLMLLLKNNFPKFIR